MFSTSGVPRRSTDAQRLQPRCCFGLGECEAHGAVPRNLPMRSFGALLAAIDAGVLALRRRRARRCCRRIYREHARLRLPRAAIGAACPGARSRDLREPTRHRQDFTSSAMPVVPAGAAVERSRMGEQGTAVVGLFEAAGAASARRDRACARDGAEPVAIWAARRDCCSLRPGEEFFFGARCGGVQGDRRMVVDVTRSTLVEHCATTWLGAYQAARWRHPGR